ncbi:MAG: helix-turn-helix transcriptional regulator [Oceanipulchritudo sp.]
MELRQQRVPVEVSFAPGGTGLIESHHEEGFFMDWRKDPFAKILIVVGGEGILSRAKQQFAIQAYSLMVIPRMARHRIADLPGRPLSLAGVCLDNKEFPDPGLLNAACSGWRVENGSALAGKVRDWVREIFVEERMERVGNRALQQALVTRMLVELARTPARTAAGQVDSVHRVEAYLTTLEQEFWRACSIDEVAASLGLSRRRFTQLFRGLAGESWLSRVNRLRLEHAAALLRSTRLSVRSVAFECGYPDLSHFYRAFKGRFGMSPGKWREQA